MTLKDLGEARAGDHVDDVLAEHAALATVALVAEAIAAAAVFWHGGAPRRS